MMLKRMNSTMVNAACPAANEIALGAYEPIRTATGRIAHSTVSCVPIPITSSEPRTIPTAVPARAERIDQPVPSALERSTDSVPSTTQKLCWTPERWAT
jgi:hypothetical protein